MKTLEDLLANSVDQTSGTDSELERLGLVRTSGVVGDTKDSYFSGFGSDLKFAITNPSAVAANMRVGVESALTGLRQREAEDFQKEYGKYAEEYLKPEFEAIEAAKQNTEALAKGIEETYQIKSKAGQFAAGLTQSLPAALTGVAASIVAGPIAGVAIGSGLGGAQVYGTKYLERRSMGDSPQDASNAATLHSMAEIGSEMLGASAWVKLFRAAKAGNKITAALAREAFTEGAEEVLAGLIQGSEDAYRGAGATPEGWQGTLDYFTSGKFLAEATENFVGGAIMGGALAGSVGVPIQRAYKPRAIEAAKQMDAAIRLAEQSGSLTIQVGNTQQPVELIKSKLADTIEAFGLQPEDWVSNVPDTQDSEQEKLGNIVVRLKDLLKPAEVIESEEDVEVIDPAEVVAAEESVQLDRETVDKEEDIIDLTDEVKERATYQAGSVKVHGQVLSKVADTLNDIYTGLNFQPDLDIFHLDDVTQEDLEAIGRDAKTIATIGSARIITTLGKDGKNKYTIIGKFGAKDKQWELSTHLHEAVGHILDYEFYQSAPEAIKSVVEKRFTEWLSGRRPETFISPDILEQLPSRGYTPEEAMGKISTRGESEAYAAYRARMFREFKAHQISAAMQKRPEVRSVIERYWAKLYAKLQELYKSFKENYLDIATNVGTMDEFVDWLYSSRAPQPLGVEQTVGEATQVSVENFNTKLNSLVEAVYNSLFEIVDGKRRIKDSWRLNRVFSNGKIGRISRGDLQRTGYSYKEDPKRRVTEVRYGENTVMFTIPWDAERQINRDQARMIAINIRDMLAIGKLKTPASSKKPDKAVQILKRVLEDRAKVLASAEGISVEQAKIIILSQTRGNTPGILGTPNMTGAELVQGQRPYQLIRGRSGIFASLNVEVRASGGKTISPAEFQTIVQMLQDGEQDQQMAPAAPDLLAETIKDEHIDVEVTKTGPATLELDEVESIVAALTEEWYEKLRDFEQVSERVIFYFDYKGKDYTEVSPATRNFINATIKDVYQELSGIELQGGIKNKVVQADQVRALRSAGADTTLEDIELMQMARDMGLIEGDDLRVYHGTPNVIPDVPTMAFADPDGLYGPGIYTTEDHVDPETGHLIVTAGYAETGRVHEESRPNILSLEIDPKPGEVFDLDAKPNLQYKDILAGTMEDPIVQLVRDVRAEELKFQWTPVSFQFNELKKRFGSFQNFLNQEWSIFSFNELKNNKDLYNYLATGLITDDETKNGKTLANEKLLELGYNFIKHEGGGITGGVAHDVWIALKDGLVKSTFDPSLRDGDDFIIPLDKAKESGVEILGQFKDPADERWKAVIYSGDGDFTQSITVGNTYINYPTSWDSNNIRLEQVWKDPNLFKLYPELKDLKVEFYIKTTDEAGYSDWFNKTIALNYRFDNDTIKQTLVHEVQHQIQGIEDFAGGSSPRRMLKMKRDRRVAFSQAKSLLKSLKDIQQRLRSKTLEEVAQDVETLPDGRERNNLEAAIWLVQSEGSVENAIALQEEEVIQADKDWKAVKGVKSVDLYWRTAGEDESRRAGRMYFKTPHQIRVELGQRGVKAFSSLQDKTQRIRTDARSGKVYLAVLSTTEDSANDELLFASFEAMQSDDLVLEFKKPTAKKSLQDYATQLKQATDQAWTPGRLIHTAKNSPAKLKELGLTDDDLKRILQLDIDSSVILDSYAMQRGLDVSFDSRFTTPFMYSNAVKEALSRIGYDKWFPTYMNLVQHPNVWDHLRESLPKFSGASPEVQNFAVVSMALLTLSADFIRGSEQQTLRAAHQGRRATQDIINPITDEVIVKAGDIIRPDAMDQIIDIGIEKIYSKPALTLVDADLALSAKPIKTAKKARVKTRTVRKEGSYAEVLREDLKPRKVRVKKSKSMEQIEAKRQKDAEFLNLMDGLKLYGERKGKSLSEVLQEQGFTPKEIRRSITKFYRMRSKFTQNEMIIRLSEVAGLINEDTGRDGLVGLLQTMFPPITADDGTVIETGSDGTLQGLTAMAKDMVINQLQNIILAKHGSKYDIETEQTLAELRSNFQEEYDSLSTPKKIWSLIKHIQSSASDFLLTTESGRKLHWQLRRFLLEKTVMQRDYLVQLHDYGVEYSSVEQRDFLYKLLTGEVSPKNQREKHFVSLIKRINAVFGKEMQDLGVKIYKKDGTWRYFKYSRDMSEDYFPHMWKPEWFRKPTENMIQSILNAGEASDRKHAEIIIKKMGKDRIRVSKFANIEMERETELGGWITDPIEVYTKYIQGSSRRLAAIKVFGENPEVNLAQLSIRHFKDSRDPDSFDKTRKLINSVLGNRVEDALLKEQKAGLSTSVMLSVGLMLQHAQMIQPGVLMNMGGVAGYRTLLQGIGKVLPSLWGNKDGRNNRRWAELAGVLAFTVNRELNDIVMEDQHRVKTDKLLRAFGITQVDGFLRIIGAMTGKLYATDLALRYAERKNPKDAKRLKDLGIDPSKITFDYLQTPEWFAQDLRMASLAFVEDTNFVIDPTRVPAIFQGSGVFRIFMLFKNFAFQQHRFLMKLVRDREFGKLISTLLGSAALGSLLYLFRLLAKGEDPEKALQEDGLVRTMWRAFVTGGGPGLFAETIGNAATFSKGPVTGMTLDSPALGLLEQLGKGGKAQYDMFFGDFDQNDQAQLYRTYVMALQGLLISKAPMQYGIPAAATIGMLRPAVGSAIAPTETQERKSLFR